MATAAANPRRGWGEIGVAFHSSEHVKQHDDGNSPPVFKKVNTSKNMASTDDLLVAYDDGSIDDEEFVLLWEQNVSKKTLASHIKTTKNMTRTTWILQNLKLNFDSGRKLEDRRYKWNRSYRMDFFELVVFCEFADWRLVP